MQKPALPRDGRGYGRCELGSVPAPQISAPLSQLEHGHCAQGHSETCLPPTLTSSCARGVVTWGPRVGFHPRMCLLCPCGALRFRTSHAHIWISFSGVRGSGTLGVHPLGSHRPELTWGLPSGTGLSVPTVLQTLHCAPPGLPGPCRLPVRGPCWSGQGTEVVTCPGLAGPHLLTLRGRFTHAPAASRQRGPRVQVP